MKYKKKKHALGFWQADPLPSTEELKEYYENIYYQLCPSSTYSPKYSEPELEYFKNRALIIENIFQQRLCLQGGKIHKNIIDIGCGEGFLLHHFLKKNWHVEGVDFSSHGIKAQCPDLLPFFTEGNVFSLLEEKIKQGKKYDFINLSNVLEHVIDPIDLLERLKHISTPTAMIHISVPNDFSNFQYFLLDCGYLLKETWFAPPDHLNYFTFDTLKILIEHVGYKISRMLADFPIELFLSNEHSNYWKDRTKGEQAHLSRVNVDNFLINQGLEKYINYMGAAAELGFSRNVKAFICLGENHKK